MTVGYENVRQALLVRGCCFWVIGLLCPGGTRSESKGTDQNGDLLQAQLDSGLEGEI
jgi:hypothetical protein